MSDVPSEILTEILSRLPVVDLLRFRCVSKPWKCLIDNDDFTRHHLNHSLNTNSNLSIILQSRHLYSADFDLLKETNRFHFQQLAYPLETKPGSTTKVLGSCNGLLALSNHPYYDTAVLWNPSVRRFLQLPWERVRSLNIDYISHGFGYDIVNDDYKLVRLVKVNGNTDIEVKVYSLKSNSWRRISDFPYHLRYGTIPGKFINGALHWNIRSKVNLDTASLVIAFDLGTEKFNLVSLPEFAVNKPLIYLFELGGCLSFTLYVNDTINVWVMKEYGVQESWSFLYTFDDSVESHDYCYIMPLAYSKCNKKVLVYFDDDKELNWYDLDKKSIDFQIVEMPSGSIQYISTCLQSLVLLNNGTCDFDLVTNPQRKQKRKAKKRKATSLV